jgi:parallel beta-helix repeat protein
MSQSLLSLLASSFVLSAPALAGTRFVDVSQTTGANDGSTWADAHQGVDGIQAALALAISGDEIWVADGLYKPTATLTRTISIDMKSGVAILGGFAGGETLASQADPAVNVTIISGDLAGDDITVGVNENSAHIVRGAGADATAVIDGFTIEAGNANAAGADNDRGGGLLFVGSSHGTVRRCIVRHNRCSFGGGAGYIRGSSPTFQECTFEDNIGASFGGAFDTANNNGATFDRCIFRGNSAARAGAVEIFGNATTKLYNCLFVNNTATGSGGGGAIWVGSGSTPTIRNCTIVDNNSTVSQAAGIMSSGSTVSVANCIIDSNTGPGGAQGVGNQVSGSTVNVSYSLLRGGVFGPGNVDALPKFVDRAAGDYRLRLGSRCVDAGDNTAVAPGVVLDLDGAPRFVDHPAANDVGNGTLPLVDMGAYETAVEPITSYCFGDGTETPCPCDNHSPVGANAGCANSLALGGSLAGAGNASLATDTLVISAGDLTGSGVTSALLLQGSRIAQIPFNDGHLCLNGTLVRLGFEPVVGGIASFPGPSDPSLSVGGGVSGGVRTYQVQYRNAVAFCTSATVNQTNGVAVIWAP